MGVAGYPFSPRFTYNTNLTFHDSCRLSGWTSILCVPSSFSLLLFLIASKNFYFASQGLRCADLIDLLAFFAPIVLSLVNHAVARLQSSRWSVWHTAWCKMIHQSVQLEIHTFCVQETSTRDWSSLLYRHFVVNHISTCHAILPINSLFAELTVKLQTQHCYIIIEATLPIH